MKKFFSRSEYEGIADTLKQVAQAYPEQSKEAEAIALAAKALAYVHSEGVARRWEEFLKDFDKKLNAEQIARLKMMGLLKSSSSSKGKRTRQ